MTLIHSRASPTAEFASMSLLLKGDIAGDRVTSGMGEPLIIPSHLAMTPQPICSEALKELHNYINLVFKGSKSIKDNRSDTMATDIFIEDEKLFSEMQEFRPLQAQGIGLYYRVIRDRPTMAKLIPLIFNASKSTASDGGDIIAKEVTAVVMCVGVSGLPSLFVASTLVYELPNRMRDCLEIMTKMGTSDISSCRALLTTFLLWEDEDRLTNAMTEKVSKSSQSEMDEGMENTNKRGKGSKKKSSAPLTIDHDPNAGFTINSADIARIMVERLAVLSVAEKDTIFRKYEAKATAEEKSNKTRRRKAGRDADLDNFDFKGERRGSLRETSGSRLSTDGGSTPKVQLRQSKIDTSSRVLAKPKQGTVPALMKSSKDLGGRSRRGSLDNAPSRQVRIQNRRGSSGVPTDGASSWSFEPSSNSSVDGSADLQSRRSTHHDGDSISSGKTPPGSIASKGSRGRQANFDPFADTFGGGNSVGGTATTVATESSTTSSRRGSDYDFGQLTDIQENNENMGFDNSYNGGMTDEDFMSPGRSSRSLGSSSDSARLQVNVALNEDLTCFYRLSKMSSCSVEGVVQVQVKSNTQSGVPFLLLIRDPSGHIQSLQENKKYAENMADTLRDDPPDNRPDYKFTVSVPRAENYFPVMRYKCGNDLRPVPIRVQTRVRLEDGHWRVALQISSNPHNEDNLTDLTIIMGVPPVVRGESLTTSPPGGVWNASKRSVIWCVSELGGGEKFQLQARFEIDSENGNSSSAGEDMDEKPKFPVLVRCQCMYAQLSDVEVEVADIPDAYPAEVKMKLARRFRLSHRERP